MTIKQLAKEISKREGLKKSVDIAQITEILGHLSDMIWEYDDGHDLFTDLLVLGEKRAKKRKKK